MNHDNPFDVFEPRSEATPGETFDSLRFGASVVLKGNMQATEWMFIQWDEAHERLWLCRPREGEMARRGPIFMAFPSDRIESFANVEQYGPARKV